LSITHYFHIVSDDLFLWVNWHDTRVGIKRVVSDHDCGETSRHTSFFATDIVVSSLKLYRSGNNDGWLLTTYSKGHVISTFSFPLNLWSNFYF